MNQRVISRIENGINTIDGSNVHINRLIGNDRIRIDELSPLLLLDEIKSNVSSHYSGGFPFHPHRGFTTITYIIEGSIEHEDSRGNGPQILSSGSVQYMVAGRGIIHSEMPINENKLFHCYQIWINLKSRDKMIQPSYQDIDSSRIPIVNESNEYKVKVISGKYRDAEGPLKAVKSSVLLLDITIEPNSKISDITIPSSYNAIVYVIGGSGRFGPCKFQKQINQSQIGVFFNNGGEASCNDILEVSNSSDVGSTQSLRFLLLAAEPIYNESVAHYGTIVMNTQQEINQSLLDFQLNNF